MNKSDSIAHVASALVQIQIQIQDVYKSKKAYNYNYADLTSVLEVCRPVCHANGVVVSQFCVSTYERPDVVGVETVLMHTSGEWMSSTLYMPVQAGKGMTLAQAGGCVITYCRRYALAAILGITQTDNDAAIEAPVPSLYAQVVEHCKLKHVTTEEGLSWCERFGVVRLIDASDAQLTEVLTILAGR